MPSFVIYGCLLEDHPNLSAELQDELFSSDLIDVLLMEDTAVVGEILEETHHRTLLSGNLGLEGLYLEGLHSEWVLDFLRRFGFTSDPKLYLCHTLD